MLHKSVVVALCGAALLSVANGKQTDRPGAGNALVDRMRRAKLGGGKLDPAPVDSMEGIPDIGGGGSDQYENEGYGPYGNANGKAPNANQNNDWMKNFGNMFGGDGNNPGAGNGSNPFANMGDMFKKNGMGNNGGNNWWGGNQDANLTEEEKLQREIERHEKAAVKKINVNRYKHQPDIEAKEKLLMKHIVKTMSGDNTDGKDYFKLGLYTQSQARKLAHKTVEKNEKKRIKKILDKLNTADYSDYQKQPYSNRVDYVANYLFTGMNGKGGHGYTHEQAQEEAEKWVEQDTAKIIAKVITTIYNKKIDEYKVLKHFEKVEWVANEIKAEMGKDSLFPDDELTRLAEVEVNGEGDDKKGQLVQYDNKRINTVLGKVTNALYNPVPTRNDKRELVYSMLTSTEEETDKDGEPTGEIKGLPEQSFSEERLRQEAEKAVERTELQRCRHAAFGKSKGYYGQTEGGMDERERADYKKLHSKDDKVWHLTEMILKYYEDMHSVKNQKGDNFPALIDEEGAREGAKQLVEDTHQKEELEKLMEEIYDSAEWWTDGHSDGTRVQKLAFIRNEIKNVVNKYELDKLDDDELQTQAEKTLTYLIDREKRDTLSHHDEL